jgi:LPS sulfotransferase NodH
MPRPLHLTKRAQLAYAWSASALAPLLAPETRFIILTTPRSGSGLLVNLLDSHRLIRCEGEIMRRRQVQVPPVTYVQSRAVLARRHRGIRAYGFKCLVPDIENRYKFDAVALVAQLRVRGYQVVALRRRDVLAQALSFLHAKGRKQWHLRTGDARVFDPLAIDPAELITMLDRIESRRARFNAIVSDVEHVEVVYEDDLVNAADHQSTIDRVCSALGLPVAPVQTNMERVAPESLPQRVRNYDEIVEALGQSRFAYLVP